MANANVLLDISRTYNAAYEWELSLYEFLQSKYDVGDYGDIMYERLPRTIEGRDRYVAYLRGLGITQPESSDIFSIVCYETPYFKLHRAQIRDVNDKIMIYSFCVFEDEYVALEARLGMV